MDTKLIVGLVLVSLIVVGGNLLIPAPIVNIENRIPLGAAAGTTHTEPEEFLNRLFVSRIGDLDSTLPGLTTTTIGTLTAAIVCNNSVVDLTTLATNSAILTFPSSSAMFDRCLQNVGDYREFWVHNGLATSSFTLNVSDQSSTLKIAVSTSTATDASSSLRFGDIAKVTAVRTASSTSRWLFWVVEMNR